MILIAVFSALGGLALLVLLGGFLLCCKVIYPKVVPVEETRRLEIEAQNMDPAEFDSWEKEELSLPSERGYQLYGIYLPLPGSQRTVVITHGITYSLFGSIKYIPLFRSRGCNVLIYDLRNHGRNRRLNTTFGFHEQHDLRQMVDWAFNRLGPGGKVGTLGESMGAAITLMEAKSDPRLSFAMADCPFSDLLDLLAYRRDVEVPWMPSWPFMPLASWFCQRLTGMQFEDISPIRGIEELSMPLFFAHGIEDRYIPPDMSMALYDNKKRGLRRLYLAPNARHAEALVKNRTEYDQRVAEFLESCGFLTPQS
jgi:uncharacterized protein